MLVEEEVSQALAEGGPHLPRIFTAGCAERVAQLFTGLNGGDADREQDVQFFVTLLNRLWTLDGRVGGKSAIEILEQFPDLRPTETGHRDVADIYSFYSVLVLRYAVLCGISGGSESAIQCGHAILTCTGQLQQNLIGSRFMEDEYEYQRNSVRDLKVDVDSLQLFRSVNSEISRNLLIAVRDRIR